MPGHGEDALVVLGQVVGDSAHGCGIVSMSGWYLCLRKIIAWGKGQGDARWMLVDVELLLSSVVVDDLEEVSL